MRLIDADALYDAFERTPWMDNADRDIAEEVAENAPTVAEDNNVPVKQPDPITGLVPCGCGGKANIWPSDLRQAMVTAYQVGCIECAMTTVWVRGKQENAVKVWNTAMGWRVDK